MHTFNVHIHNLSISSIIQSCCPDEVSLKVGMVPLFLELEIEFLTYQNHVSIVILKRNVKIKKQFSIIFCLLIASVFLDMVSITLI